MPKQEVHSFKDLGKHRAAAPSQLPTPSSQSPMGLPNGYLQDGYFDEQQHLKRDYIVEYAQEIARQLAYDKYKPMTAAGLRRFFTKVRFLERKLMNKKGDFAAIAPEILALIPYVYNAKTRGVVPHLFQEFIEKNVNTAVKSQEAFLQGFLKHFEYVVAFFPKSK